MNRFNVRIENAMRRTLTTLTLSLVFGAYDVYALNQQPPSDASREESISQLIVRYKAATANRSATEPAMAATESDRMQRLSARAGVDVAFKRPLMERTSVYVLAQAMRRSDAQRVADALAADPAVEWAVVDRRMYLLQAVTPNDKYFPIGAPDITPYAPNSISRNNPTSPTASPVPNGQWYLRGTEQASSINATGAWGMTTGSVNIVGAVLDTGVLFDHPDLGRAAAAGRLLPGYDFISDVDIANDGDGRDPDPSDPGDWINSADRTNPKFPVATCPDAKSSWHGSFVASVLGAKTNNAGEGIAGVDQAAQVLPVRVLGKCGGLTSDIIDAMRWAVGISIAGVPDNPKPARVLNLSLGGKGACLAAEQAAVDDVRARGAIVVAAAGNESGTVTSPASCNGAIAVAGVRNEGDKVGYSSLGPEVKISAPAGNCGTAQGSACLFGIIGASNTGTTVPATNTYSNEVGTSFSAPLVSGVATLMLSVHPGLLPDAVLARLQQSARKFPTVTETVVDPATGALVTSALPQCNSANPTSGRPDNRCNCTTSTCGAGMLDALGAVNAALRPQALITGSATVALGKPELLSGAPSTASNGRTIAAYAWQLLSAPAGTTISGANTAQFSVTSTVAGNVTVQLTVTDSQGQVDTATATFAAGNPPPPPPPSSGGGGGAIGVLGLLLLAGAHVVARRNRLLRG